MEDNDLIYSSRLNSVAAPVGRRRALATLTVVAALIALIAVTVPTYGSANSGTDLSSTEKALLKSGEPLTVGLDAETGAITSAEKALLNSGKSLTVGLDAETGAVVSIEPTKGAGSDVVGMGVANP